MLAAGNVCSLQSFVHRVSGVNNYVVFMCIFFTLLCLLYHNIATTRNPCVALQRQLSIGNYEVAFVHFMNHLL